MSAQVDALISPRDTYSKGPLSECPKLFSRLWNGSNSQVFSLYSRQNDQISMTDEPAGHLETYPITRLQTAPHQIRSIVHEAVEGI